VNQQQGKKKKESIWYNRKVGEGGGKLQGTEGNVDRFTEDGIDI